jgi:hypothetical protein
MDRTVAKFSNHEDAEQATREHYRSLTPQQRIRIQLELIAQSRPDNDTCGRPERVVESLNSHKVEYIVVGGFALAFHGHPRLTALDILIRNSRENADRVYTAISKFGFESAGLSPADFAENNRIIQLGRPPVRLDILTTVSGVDFEEVWRSRMAGDIDGTPVPFISRDCLIKNKKAANRAQDRADLEALGAG